MITHDGEWDWYTKTRSQLRLFGRLAKTHWDRLPAESSLWDDDRFKSLDAATIEEDSIYCPEHLDDFAVLILFSVFESAVRDHVLADVRKELNLLSHDLLARIVDEAMQDVESGSFFRVLEVFKGRDADMVEEVNQVRKSRNWVAHGRRTKRPAAVDPRAAYDRLNRFLDGLGE